MTNEGLIQQNLERSGRAINEVLSQNFPGRGTGRNYRNLFQNIWCFYRNSKKALPE
jgi:hypothetical protein